MTDITLSALQKNIEELGFELETLWDEFESIDFSFHCTFAPEQPDLCKPTIRIHLYTRLEWCQVDLEEVRLVTLDEIKAWWNEGKDARYGDRTGKGRVKESEKVDTNVSLEDLGL